MIVIKFIFAVLIAPIVLLFPRDKKKILFGAWAGNQFSDNPKYFMLYLLGKNLGYKCYWVGNVSVKDRVATVPGVRFVRKGSFISIWHVLTTSWMCCNIRIATDITRFPTFGRVKQINLWHGTSYKGLASKNATSPQACGWLHQVFRDVVHGLVCYAWTQASYGTFSSNAMCSQMPLEAPYSFSETRSIGAGSPRIDFLINNCRNTEFIHALKHRYAEMLGYPEDKRWILYMPTWRKGFGVNYSFLNSQNADKILELLDSKNAILIEKQHPQVMKVLGLSGGHKGNLFAMSAGDATLNVDVQELLLVSDVLITDYSSVFCDFETMSRPVIYWAYDYEAFLKNEQGVEMPLEDVAAGPIAKSEAELMQYLGMSDQVLLEMKGPKANVLVEGETGHACERFAKWMEMI